MHAPRLTWTSAFARGACLIVAAAVGSLAQAQQPDRVLADFEGKDYGDWKVEGSAFGPRPAQGTLDHQMPVSGHLGRGLVNSFFGGDGSVGILTSPEFEIQRKFIKFLIGGGYDPEKTCINLLVNGKVVRTATGPNKEPGGTEHLDPASWDVSDLIGQRARIQIVDQATGGWGHINVDHIVQSDKKPAKVLSDVKRELVLQKRYLCLPVTASATKRKVSVFLAGKLVRDCDLEAADGPGEAYACLDLQEYRGKSLVISVDRLPDDSQFLVSLRQSDVVLEPDNLYREDYRPQFHFTPRTNWTNDPNGLVYYEGEYHLFFQHNPYGIPWGNMTWGHAVSPDLVHWTELQDALHPDRLGTMFSGSAVVDGNNTAGFRSGSEKTLVCIYTAAGGTSLLSRDQPFTQCIAYSSDRGRTWTKYEKNPVLPHVAGSNRDPKVVWHEPTQRWIMALFLDRNDFGLFSSPDLKTWTQLQTITVPDCGECPDFFEIPVEGEAKKQWVFTAANGRYLVGDFDGRKFTPLSSQPLPGNWGRNYYAVQTYSDTPDGRRIQIAWMNGGRYPGMPFNQQMSFPGELKLRRLPDGLRLCRTPVREIERLHGEKHSRANQTLQPGENPLAAIQGDLFHIRAEIEPGAAAEITFRVRGEPITWAAREQKLAWKNFSAPLALNRGRLQLQILVDRTSLEIFAQNGAVPFTGCFLPPPTDKSLGLTCSGGPAKIISLDVIELRSAWTK